MKIRRKGASIAFTATLLASLIAVVAAPFASAAVSVTSAGSVPRGGTSTNPAAFTFTENSIACFSTGVSPDALDVTILDSAGNPTVHFVGPVTLSGNTFSLAATASITGVNSNTITINFGTSDPNNIESITASAKISADSGAAAGAIKATLGGSQAGCVTSGTTTASGRLATATPVGASTFNLILDAGSCPFEITVTGGAGPMVFTTNPESLAINSATMTGPNSETVTTGSTGATTVFTGKPTGASTTTVLVFPGSPFTAGALVGDNATITSGPGSGNGAGSTSIITANTTSTITVAPAYTTAPNGSSTVVISSGASTGATAAFAHAAGEQVTQTGVVNCNSNVLNSPGTVANALTVTSSGTPTVLPGENNQATGTVTVSEAPTGSSTSLNGQTLTFTISSPAAGVVFSASPTVTYSGGDISGPSVCTLSIDRLSCTVSGIVDTSASAVSSVTITGRVDVDASVPVGTAVKITVSTSPAVALNPATVTVAFVGRVVAAVAAQPTIYIGFNDQQSGMKTLTESGAGFFTAGGGANNTFGLCLITGETFTRAPWAVVTAGTGLLLETGTPGVGAASVKGTLYNGGMCAYWTVFSPSTAAATIEIRGSTDNTTPLPSGALNGPRLSVPSTGAGATPGSTQDALLIGTFANVTAGCTTVANCTANGAFSTFLSQAIRAFKSSVTVVALSQPFCAPGTADCLAGSITITETLNGQFKSGQIICLQIQPRASNNFIQDTWFDSANTNQLPIVTTNASSGLLAGAVGVGGNSPCPAGLGDARAVAGFTITQQSFGPTLGQITISNLHYVITADAPLGPVLLRVFSNPGGGGSGVQFSTTVSNAIIGAAPNPPALTKTSAASAVTKTQNAAAFSVSTKVVTLVSTSNNIVTIRIKLDPALVGRSVIIQRATKNSAGVWSAFTNLTTRIVGSDGYAYYYASAHSAQWNSYRGVFPGTAQWAASRSQTVQVRWV